MSVLKWIVVFAVAVFGAATPALCQSPTAAQTLPATQPATAPTTFPAPYVLIMPPGMVQVTVGERTALCLPEIADAVKAALEHVPPATRPTTLPSDMLANLAAARDGLISQMTADLGVSKDQVTSFLDNGIKTELTRMANIKPRAYVMVCTERQVTADIKAGWNAPQFHYNGVMDQTFFASAVQIVVGGPPSDVVVWAEINAGDSPADITKTVTTTYQSFEHSFPASNSYNTISKTNELFVNFIGISVMRPLKLPTSESWIGRGLMFDLAAKYTAIITGISRAEVARVMAMDNPSNPIRMATLDLTAVHDLGDIRDEYRMSYVDAINHKSSVVVEKVLDKAGDGVVPKILAELKSNVPADNEALIQLVRKITGMDVTDDLKPSN